MYPDTKIIPFGIINKMFVWRKDKIMGRDLQGRVAIVTGSGRGIGLGIAKKLSEKGASVVISDVNEDNARNGVAEIEAMGGKAIYILMFLNMRMRRIWLTPQSKKWEALIYW